MSKQVELKGNNLIVRTTEDYESALRVIVQRKGKAARVFSFITPAQYTIEEVQDWIIAGYRVEDLYKLALILRDRRIEDIDLKDFNACFFDGYKRAQEDIHKQLEESVKNILHTI